MKYKIFEARYNNLLFKIEEDLPEVGAYLYVFESDKCIADYLQNTVNDCMNLALDKYNIPKGAWIEKGEDD
jgi:hypothetical protein